MLHSIQIKIILFNAFTVMITGILLCFSFNYQYQLLVKKMPLNMHIEKYSHIPAVVITLGVILICCFCAWILAKHLKQSFFRSVEFEKTSTHEKRLSEMTINNELINTCFERMTIANAKITNALDVVRGNVTVQNEITQKAHKLFNDLNLNSDSDKKQDDINSSRSLLDAAKEGSKVVRDSVSSIKKIEDSSQKIVKIIEVIDTLTLKTTLLSMNAAIEAARAGEYGSTFAVVAGEIKNLADSTQKSSKEINLRIDEIIQQIKTSSEQSQEAIHVIDEIVSQVENVQSEIVYILDSITSLESHSHELVQATDGILFDMIDGVNMLGKSYIRFYDFSKQIQENPI